MPSKSTDLLTAWSSAFVGCAFFLIAGLLPRSPVSLALLGQVGWLTLVGSIPTTLALVGARRVAGSKAGVLVASMVAVASLSLAMGWQHTDFLLSGPRWALHPRRTMARAAMGLGFGVAGAAGWGWLVLGMRRKSALGLVSWVGSSLVAVVGMTALMVRYRAYDHSMAQLVFPAGVLCGAILDVLVHGSRRRRAVWIVAVMGLTLSAGSRFDAAWVAKGRREVIAQSRAGALAMLYVIPHGSRDGRAEEDGSRCAALEPLTPDEPIAIPAEARRNVIVITVDALRKDVVGMEVDGRPVTPSLSRLSDAGVAFTNATSTYPATLFAMGSAFTGLTPAELYVHPSLPETIFTRSRGVVDRQLAVLPDVSWFRLPIVEQFLAPGVDTVFAKSDADASATLIGWLGDARHDGASVMAWIHYYAPHDPYEPQPGMSFGTGKKNAYLSEVAYFDRELGRLIEYLTRHRWLDDTLVVFFSDHGEALGEKSYWGHHVYLDAWMVDVPLVLRHADLPAAAPSVGVSLADVGPTVLRFLGVPIPGDLAGQSLFGVDPNRRDRVSFSEAFPVRGRALFDGFRLPALDDATIRERIRSIRETSRGYEPKVAVTGDRHRLIQHRSADAILFYERGQGSSQKPAQGPEHKEARAELKGELERWEQEQQTRIRCRLQLTDETPSTPRLE